MSSLARLWRHKDGRAPSSTVKKLDFTAVCRLVRLRTVLYGHRRSLSGILPCLTAPSRILLCSAPRGGGRRQADAWGIRRPPEAGVYSIARGACVSLCARSHLLACGTSVLSV